MDFDGYYPSGWGIIIWPACYCLGKIRSTADITYSAGMGGPRISLRYVVS